MTSTPSRRLATVLLVSVLALLGLAAPAGAGDGNGGFGVHGAEGDGGGGDGDGGSGVPLDFELDFDEDGEGVGNEPGSTGCWAVVAVPAGQGGTYAEALAEQDYYGNNGALWGPCRAETIDPAIVALHYWRRVVQPPPPTPLTAAPGWALPGKRVYLEIGGANPAVATVGTPIGPATFTMTPRYVVSWGDGTSTGTTAQGRPYPGGPGEITHVFTTEGRRTITVQAYWHATWALAGDGGALAELPTPTTASLALPVEERQVVTR